MQAHANTEGVAQEWVRLMLGCVGRGGNAQAVRDEILNIMHRNNIPEKNGTWMEQWHQKLVRAQWFGLIMHSQCTLFENSAFGRPAHAALACSSSAA